MGVYLTISVVSSKCFLTAEHEFKMQNNLMKTKLFLEVKSHLLWPWWCSNIWPEKDTLFGYTQQLNLLPNSALWSPKQKMTPLESHFLICSCHPSTHRLYLLASSFQPQFPPPPLKHPNLQDDVKLPASGPSSAVPLAPNATSVHLHTWSHLKRFPPRQLTSSQNNHSLGAPTAACLGPSWTFGTLSFVAGHLGASDSLINEFFGSPGLSSLIPSSQHAVGIK